MKTVYRHFFAICSIAFLLLSCSDDDNPGSDVTASDLAGIWIVDQVINGNCRGSSYPQNETELFSASQDGNKLLLTNLGSKESIQVSISGQNVSWQITEKDDNDELETSFTGTVSSDLSKITGTANWVHTDKSSSYSCNGTTTINARKAKSTSLDVNGTWNGLWRSSSGAWDGTFEVNITRDNSLLTGKISIPEIFGESKDLMGVVSGNEIIFGDIEGNILFSGELEPSADSASGSYYSEYFGNEGNWSASKNSGAVSSYLVVLDSIVLNQSFTGDITFDGTDFWAISLTQKIYRISTTLGIIDSIDAPGNYPQGLAYNGSKLVIGDGPWGLNKFFKLDPSGKTVVSLPNQNNVTGLTFDGANIWAISDNKTISKLDQHGKVISEIPCRGNFFSGLTYDGNNLHYSSFNMGKTYVYEVSVSGEYIDSIEVSGLSPGGLTYDGSNLWYINSDSVVTIDNAGNITNQFMVPFENHKDMAYDGSNLWIVGNDFMDASINQLSVSGVLINTLKYPGQRASGLTFDGTFLRLADEVTDKIYSISLSGGDYFDYPSSDDINYLTIDGSGEFWGLNYTYNQIVHFNNVGSLLAILSSDVADAKGLAYDGSNLWVINGFTSLDKLSKLDANGQAIAEYSSDQKLVEPMALAYDGSHFWYLGGEFMSGEYKLYKLGFN